MKWNKYNMQIEFVLVFVNCNKWFKKFFENNLLILGYLNLIIWKHFFLLCVQNFYFLCVHLYSNIYKKNLWLQDIYRFSSLEFIKL